jgi:hypothetical protein
MPASIATQLAQVPRSYVPVALAGGKLRVLVETFTLAGEATGTYAIGAPVPAGAVPLAGLVVSSISLGTSTIAIGTAATPAKYRAAATIGTADAPALFGTAAATGGPLAAAEQLVLTVGVAALPSAGRLVVLFVYADNS